MPLIRCIDCKKFISDRVETCPHCGCPVSVSREAEEKRIRDEQQLAALRAEEERKRIEELKNAPAVKTEVDIEADLESLYDIFAPAVINEREIKKVGASLLSYYDKYEEIGSGVVYTSCHPLEREIERHWDAIEYMDKQKEQKLKFALNQYTAEKNKPIEGLGFGIITSSAADAALYNVMSARNAAKQYMKNEADANQHLLENLSALGMNSDDVMIDSHVRDFKYKMRKALEDIKLFAERRYFIDSHKEFWFEPSKYDNGLEIDGVRVYSILYRGENTRVLYSGYTKDSGITRAILEKAEEQGYINCYYGNYYGSTLKYEKEVLAEIFKKENPEEYANIQAEWEANAETVYNKAMDDLNNGLYYEAATALGSISGYKDAIEISVKIWHEKLLRSGRIEESLDRYYGLTDDGRVLTGGGVKPEEKAKISSWRGVQSILYGFRGLIGHTVDGNLNYSGDDIFINSDNHRQYQFSKIKNVKSLNGHYVYIAVKEDGNITVFGDNKKGLCDEAKGITGIEKAHARTSENIALLTKEGKVMSIGGNYSGYEEWEDITDVVSDYSGLFGFKKDGTVNFIKRNSSSIIKKYRGTHPDEWEDIYKYFDDCTAIDKYGRVYSYGDNALAGELDGLKDIVDIVNETGFTVCLKADGTLHVIKSKTDIPKWENLVTIFGNYKFVMGIKRDGTVVCEGDIEGKEEIEKWRFFEDVNKSVNLKEEFVKAKREKAQKELDKAEAELANLKGLFAGMRKKQLEERIAALKTEISSLQKS